MSLKTNSIISDVILNVNCDTDFSNQVSFDVVPHCNISPEYGNDICNKSYVDSRVGNSGNGIQLYFNKSVIIDSSNSELGTEIVIIPGIDIQFPQTGINLISSFLTILGYPNQTRIPSGIWELNQYGLVDSSPRLGTLYYYFTLVNYHEDSSTTLIGRSGNSSDIDSINTPSLYFATLTLGPINLLLTDRLQVNIYSEGINTGGSTHTLNSFFQGPYYSFINTPLISGNNLLASNNDWTGANTFELSPNVPDVAQTTSNDFCANTRYVRDAITDLSNSYVTLQTTQTIDSYKTFSITPLISELMPSGATSTTQIGTMSWVQSAITNGLLPYATITSLTNYVTIATEQTISAIKTFTSGIKTNSIDTISATSLTIGNTTANNITIGSSTLTPTISIDTNSTSASAIQIGTTNNTKSIIIGGFNSTTKIGNVHISGQGINGSGAGQPLNIAGGQTGGQLNIALSQNRSGAITIGGGLGSTNDISIGNTTTPTKLFGPVTSTSLITANGGLNTTIITLSYGTLPIFTTSQIGYNTSSATVTASLPQTAGIFFLYSPTVGVAGLFLPVGTYIASLFGIVIYTGTIIATAISVSIGIASSSGTTTNSTGTLAPFQDSIVEYPVTSTLNTDQVFYPVTLAFTVPVAKYYYGCISSNVGTLTGGSFKTSIRLVSLTRIA
jgi:hypothetical protein